jgi:hypothetical protein
MKKWKNSLTTLLILYICSSSMAQRALERCPSANLLLQKTKQNRNYAQNRLFFEEKIQQIIHQKKARTSAINELIKIPIVVHVIHNNQNLAIGGVGNSNISDEQIKSQIEVLNEDYRRKPGTLGFNTNPIGEDLNIEFYLAKTDPEGKPSTGIIRKLSNKNNYDPLSDADQLALSAISYWPSTCYLNIWVTTLNVNYLGYSQFPAAPNFDGLDPTNNEAVDGFFIDYRFMGRNAASITSKIYNKGRTATHEIGHWLGLIHTWGDEDCGSDYVTDTPPTQGPNLTVVCAEKFSNCAGPRTRNMIENFMDYTIDSCMNVFTKGQSERIRAVFEASPSRKKLYECITKLPETETLLVKIAPNPVVENISGQILFKGTSNVQILITSSNGQTIDSQIFTNKSSFEFSIPKSSYPPGIYLVLIRTKTESSTHRIFIN